MAVTWDKIVTYTYKANSALCGLMCGYMLVDKSKLKWPGSLGAGQNVRLFQLIGTAVLSWVCSSKTGHLHENIDILGMKTSCSLFTMAYFLGLGPVGKNKASTNEERKQIIFGIIACILVVDTALQIREFFTT